MKYFSTFSGIGGFEYGIQQAIANKIKPKEQSEKCIISKLGDSTNFANSNGNRGWTSATCVGYSEIDKYAIKVYERQFNGHKNYGDITTINANELPDFDCLVGGFPCQAFSIAGKRRGFEDTRGTLFFDLARILRAKQPRLFVFENVKGLLSHDNGNTFRTIISTIDDLGYDCQWQVLNSKNHGVPQNRERIFIVGHLRGTPRPEVFPIREIGDVIIERKQTLQRKVQDNTKKQNSLNIDESLSQNGKNRHIRRLTPLECERLQGFPDNWTKSGVGNELISDTQRYKMCGNAVTTNVIESIFERILA